MLRVIIKGPREKAQEALDSFLNICNSQYYQDMDKQFLSFSHQVASSPNSYTIKLYAAFAWIHVHSEARRIALAGDRTQAIFPELLSRELIFKLTGLRLNGEQYQPGARFEFTASLDAVVVNLMNIFSHL